MSSGTRKSIGFTGLRVIVQSEKDAAFVEGRIDVFWEEYKTVLDKMSEEEFDKYKTTVVNKKLEDHKNMYQECVSYFSRRNERALMPRSLRAKIESPLD